MPVTMAAASLSFPDPAVSVRGYLGAYEPHSHAHAQVLLGIGGSLQLEVDGHPAFVDPSCGLVVPAGSRHGYLADSPAKVLVVDCDATRATERLRRFALPPAWRSEPGACDADMLLSRVIGARTLQPRRRLDLVQLAMAVDAELHRGWSVAGLASLCRFSPQRFRARFAELTGQSPLAWVRQRRLDAAERLLGAGVPLETTALQVGYSSASALCFALRRERGVGARSVRAGASPVRASLDI
ncbi:helix-turn-helix domain-containing protein [Rubrivivax sp. RP6-9]|uniref:helix-turn-helix domain-containing protein n=1 Tax=Rubrivivax sp. RP6-9 TaxID=3415750 RepID=UPI003CC6C825